LGGGAAIVIVHYGAYCGGLASPGSHDLMWRSWRYETRQAHLGLAQLEINRHLVESGDWHPKPNWFLEKGD